MLDAFLFNKLIIFKLFIYLAKDYNELFPHNNTELKMLQIFLPQNAENMPFQIKSTTTSLASSIDYETL